MRAVVEPVVARARFDILDLTLIKLLIGFVSFEVLVQFASLDSSSPNLLLEPCQVVKEDVLVKDCLEDEVAVAEVLLLLLVQQVVEN